MGNALVQSRLCHENKKFYPKKQEKLLLFLIVCDIIIM